VSEEGDKMPLERDEEMDGIEGSRHGSADDGMRPANIQLMKRSKIPGHCYQAGSKQPLRYGRYLLF
jgi:hypothetical protein